MTRDLPSGKVQAVRYRYTGHLSLDTCCDDQGQWLGMRFQGRDGSEIRYQCSTCRGSARPRRLLSLCGSRGQAKAQAALWPWDWSGVGPGWPSLPAGPRPCRTWPASTLVCTPNPWT